MAKTQKKDSPGTGKGLIQAGGDKSAYLGHFRSEDTLKKGHNQGAPSPLLGPSPGGRNLAARRGGAGPVPAPTTSTPLTAGGGGRQSPAPLGATGITPTTPAPRPAPSISTPLTPGPVGGGAAAPVGPAATPRAFGRGPGWTATHGVGAARRGVRQARRTGGDVGAAQSALGEAKGARKSAFQSIKTARGTLAAAKTSPGGGRVKEARTGVKAAKQAAKSEFKGAFKARQAKRRAKAGGNGGGANVGPMSGFTGGLF